MTGGNNKILAIIPGTCFLGIAILYDAELIEWVIKCLPDAALNGKIDFVMSLISQLIDRYKITAIAIKQVSPSKGSPELSRIHAEIKTLGKSRKLTALDFPLNTIKRSLMPTKGNRSALMEKVTEMYPVLFHEMEIAKAHKSQHLLRIFEAIALGVTCFRYLESHIKRSRKK